MYTQLDELNMSAISHRYFNSTAEVFGDSVIPYSVSRK